MSVLIAGLELRRRSRGMPIDAMTAFNCYYLVLYALVPINVLCLGEDVVRQKYAYETFGEGNGYTALAILFSYLLFCLGYSAKSSKSSISVGGGYFSLLNSARVAKIIFFLGVLTTVIYVVQIGGLSEVITMASEARSGEYTIESKYIFYRHFSQFSADAFVLFFAVLVGKKLRRIAITKRDKAFLLCAFVFFVYFALSTAGRRQFIYPIILCYLVSLSVGMRVKKWAVVVFALVFIFAGLGSLIGSIGSVDSLPALVELGQNNENASWPALLALAYDNATQGLADSFIHFVGAQKASLWQFGFLTDIVNLPRDFFPSRLFGFERPSHIHGDVSEYFLGHPLGDDLSGEENLGLHGYLLVNFGYVGMFAAFFLLGLFYKWIHIRFKPAEPKDPVAWLIYWWVVLAFFVYFREGLLIFVIKTQLTWWVTIALLVYFQTKHPTRLRASGSIGTVGNLGTGQASPT